MRAQLTQIESVPYPADSQTRSTTASPRAQQIPSDRARHPTSGPKTSSKAEQEARLAILRAADQFAASSNVPRIRAAKAFCEAYNKGRAKVPESVRGVVPKISPRTLFRWRAVLRAGKPELLAVERGASRRGSSLLETANDGAVQAFILDALAKSPDMSASQIRADVAAAFGPTLRSAKGADLPLPSIRTFQVLVRFWKDCR